MGLMAGRLRACTAALLLAVTALAAVGAQAQTEAELQSYQRRLQQLFERLDRNGDQRLQPEEVEGHPYLQRHFQRLDQRGRGYLVPDDLKASPMRADQRCQRLLNRADRNGDGRIERREAEAIAWLLRLFDEVDRNGDGSVDCPELRGLAEQRRRQTLNHGP